MFQKVGDDLSLRGLFRNRFSNFKQPVHTSVGRIVSHSTINGSMTPREIYAQPARTVLFEAHCFHDLQELDRDDRRQLQQYYFRLLKDSTSLLQGDR